MKNFEAQVRESAIDLDQKFIEKPVLDLNAKRKTNSQLPSLNAPV